MLLATKFHRPLTIGRLTARPRLDARLDESLAAGCPLVLVTAPAGFGKSTLVSAWLSRSENRDGHSPADRPGHPGAGAAH